MNNTEKIKRSLKKRHRQEKRFILLGRMAVLTGFLFLTFLLVDIVTKAWPAFQQNWIKLEVSYDPQKLGVEATADVAALKKGDYRRALKKSLYAMFPDVTQRRDKKALFKLISSGAEYQIRDALLAAPDMLGTTQQIWAPVDDDVDSFLKEGHLRELDQSQRRVKDNQVAWLDQLKEQGRLESRWNWSFLTSSDSREPELAGVAGALKGTMLTILVTLALSFPLGLAAAVYLEEFAPQNRWTDLIEINVNNLAAVPSIVFGLLGLAVFISFFGVPRSAPLVGGMVLTLMTLPTIIIASRASLKSVPPSIRDAALALGASKVQTVFQHVVPLAMPGILTGTIIGMAQALGETAPLLMIGMVAFIVDIPQGITDSATVLPVQIYLWADSPERTFMAKTSAAIIVLLLFMVAMNLLAVFLRKKLEHKW
ncbi:MAG: phosphate ABC transporter permease PstA [Pseudomonadota bacterium]